MNKVTNWGIGILANNKQISRYNYYRQTSMKLPSCFHLKASALLFGTVLSSLFVNSVQANPNISDATIVGNVEVAFDQRDPTTLNISTLANGAIIDWNAFSIGVGETTNFNQVNTSSAVLNRITGTGVSDIQGQLTSNGKVFLINPNGIVFGQNAIVNTSGLVASTLGITNDDFTQGQFRFTGTTGRIENNGQLRVDTGDGSIVLLAPDIQNNGVISTDDGAINLIAGKGSVEIFPATSNLSFQLDSTNLANGVLENIGELVTQDAAIGVFADQLTQKGMIKANQVVTNANGDIFLMATSNLDIQANSVITSGIAGRADGGNIRLESGENINVGGQVNIVAQKGGNINISGKQVLVSGTVDASGVGQAGNISIGNSTLGNEATTTITDSAIIKANSQQDKGGNIILEGNSSLNVAGQVSAAAALGAAGSINIAGAQIAVSGTIDASGLGSGGFINIGNIGGISNVNTTVTDTAIIKVDTEGNGGFITLEGSNNMDMAGRLSALSSGGIGGNIAVLGEQITISGSVDASGVKGGGFINIGEFLSSTTTALKATINTTVSTGATIKADAQQGNGGSVNLQSSGLINVAGQLSTISQTIGGFISLSGGQVMLSGRVDVSGVEQGGFATIGNRDFFLDTISLSSLPTTTLTTVTNTAVIKADAQQGQGGDINIQSDGMTIMDGQVTSISQISGGRVHVFGKDITVSGAVDVSGNTQGGDIGIGDVNIDNPLAIDNTNSTIVTRTANLRSDGLENGKGGGVTVLAQGSTQMDGVLSTQGGTVSGDGGFIGIVGIDKLGVTTASNASAVNGKAGNVVVVSKGLTIDTEAANVIAGTLNTGTNVVLIGSGGITSTELDAIVLTRTGVDINSGDGTNTGTAGKIASSGGIEIDAAITKTSGGDVSLSLDANDTIAVNASINSTSNKLNVALSTSAGTSDTISINTFIDTNGGVLTVPDGVVNPDPVNVNVNEAVENITNTTVEGVDDIDNASEESEINEDEEKEEDLLQDDGKKDQDEENNLDDGSPLKQC